MGIDLAVSLGSMLIAPVFDFIRKKFIKTESDTPERTMGTLATTKPEALAGYTTAMATYLDSQVKYFNRDVVGTTSSWVNDLRASIRPIAVAIGLLIFLGSVFIQIPIPDGIRLFFEAIIGSWFGDRISSK